MVLCQLGPDILTYEIQAEGGLTCIVHWNQLFLLLPKEEDGQLCAIGSCPLGRDHGFSWTVTRICSLRSGHDPQGEHENVRGGRHMWSGVHLPTDPARPGGPRLPDLEEGHVS